MTAQSWLILPVLAFCGAGLAQYGNVLLSLLDPLLPMDSYSREMSLLMDQKSFLQLVFYIGILAPIGEEMSFRLLFFLRLRDRHRLLPSVLLSSLVFGIYHGNLAQGIYAGVLGCFFALVLELTGNPLSSIACHVGANIWSLVLSYYPYQILLPPFDRVFLLISVLMILVIFQTIQSLSRSYQRRGRMRRI